MGRNTLYRLAYLIYVQLFLGLFSFPLLISWGMPCSLATIVGNILFAPMLTLYLLLCSCIFFSELFHIPNSLLIQLLEWCTTLWTWCAAQGSSSWLVEFARPSFIILFAIPLAAILLLQFKFNASLKRRIATLSLLWVFVLTILSLKKSETFHTIPCKKGEITVMRSNNHIILIDPGYLALHANPTSWIRYTLKPELAKKYGSSTIDHLVILKMHPRLFETIDALCKLTSVHHVYMPWFKEPCGNSTWRGWLTLRNTTDEKKNNLHVITTRSITVQDEQRLTLTIQRTKPNDWSALSVHGTIDGQQLNYGPAHSYRKKKHDYLKINQINFEGIFTFNEISA